MHSCLFCLNRCLACRIVRGQAAGSTICSFRMYQSPKFSTVVFTPDELKYWDPSATPCTPFAPTLVHLESEYETHTILLRNPSGRLALASRKENWIPMLEKALRECSSDLRSDSSANNSLSTGVVAQVYWREGDRVTSCLRPICFAGSRGS
jgi:hypothetical protein